MRWTGAAVGAALAALAAAPVHADEAEANRLLVEAIALAEQAAHAPGDEALALYAQAAANLDAIVADHPETDLAVLIATNQPIGSFRTWEVRHELARLGGSADLPPPQQFADIAPWEHQFGDGNANMLRGDPAHFMTDLIARGDGSSVAVGNHWHDGVRDVWLTAYAADGAPLWERSYPGLPCGAAPIEDGFVVVGADIVPRENYGILMLLDDGLAPTAFALDLEPYGVAPDGSGGFVVAGVRDTLPIVQRYRADGDLTWTWSTADVFEAGMDSGGAVAAAPVPGSSEIMVLGFTSGAGEDGSKLSMWIARLGDDGTMMDQTVLDEVGPPSLRPCDYVLHPWSIDAATGGFLLRYLAVERGTGVPRTTVMLVDPAGVEQWRRVHPIDPQSQPEPQAVIEAGVDEIYASSATADGGALVAGYRNRPMGRGGAFVARWDSTGEVLWSTELRRPDDDDHVADAYFGAVVEAADGGILAVMSDGIRYMRPRGFIFRLGADGAAP